MKLKRRVMTNSELHDCGFHFEEIFAWDFLVQKLKMRFPTFSFSTFAKHKNFPLDISMLLTRIETRKYRTFSKIGAYEPWSADYLERFWFLLIKVGQGRGSWQKFVFLFRIWETVGQRMQYLGAHHRTISLSAAKSFWWKSKLCSQSSSSS